MAIASNDLARLAGPDSKEIVVYTLKKWEDKVRERIRVEMALKLVDDSVSGRRARTVPVSVSDGLPEPLAQIAKELKQSVDEVVGTFRPPLQNLKQDLPYLRILLQELSRLDGRWAERCDRETIKVEAAENLVAELLKMAERATLIKKIKNVRTDIFGAYFPVGKQLPGQQYAPPQIEIYWTAIGAVAKTMNLDVEGLTLAVLIHELVHAYSHLGADTDGTRWDDNAFVKAQDYIVEGIAQYYTDKIVWWFSRHHQHPAESAFRSLLGIQSLPYKIHLQWKSEYSPEMLRAAIIECRNRGVTQTEDFFASMGEAKLRLGAQTEGDFSHDLVPEVFAEIESVGRYYFEGGITEFQDWAENVIDALGRWTAPYLRRMHGHVRKVVDEQTIAAN